MIRFYYLCIFVSCVFSSQILFNPKDFNSNQPLITDPHIIAIMVEFQQDSNPLTSGDGLFLDSIDIDMIWNGSGSDRCEGFLVDRPPHNASYFSAQMDAVSNYFKIASNDNIQINGHIIENSNDVNGRYKLSEAMDYYALSDNRLSVLFKESLELAKSDIEEYLSNQNIDLSQVVFTVFHAGIGQDFSFPTFDPTIYDIKSAYIEESMFNVDFPEINGEEIKTGILLPETQNMLFFDGIEDIFYGYESYCDFQLGMTGTFSFLMGYALGLPPLFNTETGKPGVGVFGLMDYGANNGRGVIPSIPSPWTRILNNWTEPINMTASCSINPLIFDLDSNAIYKFDISDDEYFLIENRSNKLDNGDALIDIVSYYNNQVNNDTLNYYSNWFDALTFHDNIFSFSNDSVIVGVSNYDLGFPGSGLLIWHIKEPINMDGINNNPNDKMIHIEEADGALDIGFESYALFSSDDPTNGTKWDFWYLGNAAYHYTNDDDEVCINPENYEILNEYNYQFICEQNGGTWINRVIFDKFSNPNSNLSDGVESFFSFEILDSVSNSTRVMAKYESPIDYMDANFDYNQIIGSSSSSVFFEINDSIKYFDFNNLEFFDDYIEGDIVLTGTDNQSDIYQLSMGYGYLDPNNDNQLVELESPNWFGYFLENEDFDIMQLNASTVNIDGNDVFDLDYPISESSSISLGDIDSDGLDEIVYVSDQGMIVAYNANGTLVNNFPVGNNYTGIVLITQNLDNEINLICRKDSHIDIIYINGDVISLPSINHGSDVMVINNKLTDGSRYYDFEISDNSYWVQRYNNHSHYPLSSGMHESYTNYPSSKKVQTFYNYPNPIKDNQTQFRFFINDLTDIEIKIYNLSGYLIDELKMNSQNITQHEYNEIQWNCSDLLPGLYFAEIISDNGQEHIIKMVVGH